MEEALGAIISAFIILAIGWFAAFLLGFIVELPKGLFGFIV